MEDKTIKIKTNYNDHEMKFEFSKNLMDQEERGYILSSAFLSYCASLHMDKQEVMELVESHYDDYTSKNDDSLFGRLNK